MKKLFYSLILLFICNHSISEELKTLSIGVERLKYAPYYSFEGDNYTGLSREIFDLFAEKKGYEIKFHILPVKRLFKEFFVKRKFDLKYPDNALWEPELRKGITVFYSKPLLQCVDGFLVVAKRKDVSLDSINSIGAVGGFTLPSMKHINESISIEYSNGYQSLLKKLLAGRIDAAFGNVEVCKYLYRESGEKGRIQFDERLPYRINDFSVSTLSRPEVIEEFNEFLNKYANEIQSIKDKYQLINPEDYLKKDEKPSP